RRPPSGAPRGDRLPPESLQVDRRCAAAAADGTPVAAHRLRARRGRRDGVLLPPPLPLPRVPGLQGLRPAPPEARRRLQAQRPPRRVLRPQEQRLRCTRRAAAA
ncbi:unnamed protein product, partial [Ectocarpus fasciculatus]